jgi:ubiquinone biosynthesis protein
MKQGFLRRNARYFNRYREILFILLKHGFGDFLSRIRIHPHGKSLSPEVPAWKAGLSRWARVRLVLEELGPAWIKLGQILSNRPDVLPRDLLVELEKLQDNVPPFPSRDALAIVVHELGKPLQEVFSEFAEKPAASASIAQVHRAVLLDGTEVALKIQRPDIDAAIALDIEILKDLARLSERYIEEMRVLGPTGIVREFEKAIRHELDFQSELTHMLVFAENFGNDSTTLVPKVYPELTTRRLLTMEYIHGEPLARLSPDDPSHNRKLIAHRGADLVLRQIFRYGYFHADPHPGNIFILPGDRVCFLDFGMIGILSAATQEVLGDLIISAVNRDARKLTRAFLKLSREQKIDHIGDLESRVSELMNQYYYLPVKKINVGDFLRDLMDLLLDYRIRLQPSLYLLMKALMSVEGIGKRLDPDFNVLREVTPFAKTMLRERLSPFRSLKRGIYSLAELRTLARDLPDDLREIVALVKDGKLRLELDLRGLDNFLSELNTLSNRFMISILLGSIIIGSSVIVHSGIPPKWYGVPVLGIAGYLVTAVIGFILVLGMLRKRTF